MCRGEACLNVKQFWYFNSRRSRRMACAGVRTVRQDQKWVQAASWVRGQKPCRGYRTRPFCQNCLTLRRASLPAAVENDQRWVSSAHAAPTPELRYLSAFGHHIMHGWFRIIADCVGSQIVELGGVGQLEEVDLVDGVGRLVVVGGKAIEQERDGDSA